MFRIQRQGNRIEKLKECSLRELGFREREHLQEWIAKDPEVLGEELLVIQKEFSGFSDTNERLDLLALDKQKSLVIIENKLDDTGRDVTWQALKYASYCSTLSKEDIREIYQRYLDNSDPTQKAEEKLSEFFEDSEYEDLQLNEGYSQRIILVAAKFRKEVTSTVLWLLNYKVRVQCFRATPYSMGDELFLNIEQIIPTQDAEEFMIGMADKTQEAVEHKTKSKTVDNLRREFWMGVIQRTNERTELYQNISPGIYNWIGAGSGVRGVSFNYAATRSYGRAELYIDRGIKEENEFVFDDLHEQRARIEEEFGAKLEWERLEEKRACRIKAERHGDVTDREQWEEMIAFMVDAMVRLEGALKGPLAEMNEKLRRLS